MQWLKIKDALKGNPGDEITIKGWVRTRRDSKAGGGLSFIALHDGTCHDAIQAVAKADLPNYADEIAHLTTGCSVEIDGTLAESKGKGQSVEVQASAVRVIGWVDDPDTYPVPMKQHTMEYLREQAHLRVRTNTLGSVARVRHTLAMGVHRFFDERDFYYVHTPIITGSDCEGAGEMFKVSTIDWVGRLSEPTSGVGRLSEPTSPSSSSNPVGSPSRPTQGQPAKAFDWSEDFFGKEANLTVSGQLNVETYCSALSRVYTFGPTFRAENSNTSRHLAEFWMIEPEIAFADLRDNAQLAEDMLKFLFDDVLTRRADDMAFFDQRIEPGIIDKLRHIIDSPFRILPYTEAIKILKDAKKKFDYPVEWGLDMQSEHERYLTEKHFKQPVVIINYPKKIKAFYMRVNDDGTDGAPEPTVAAMDVLAPGIGEIIGGSQREERLDVLDSRLEEMNLNKDDYWWYRDLRRYGTVPHAGFGLGFERLIQFCTGMQNIRDVIPFPRAPRQCEF